LFVLRGTGMILTLALLSGTATAEEQKQSHQDIVHAAISGAGSIPKQAKALALLAWPTEPGDPEVSAYARYMLVNYGRNAIQAIRGTITEAKPELQADVVKALSEAFGQVHSGIPAGYLSGLEDAIWFGTREAREVAILEIAPFRFGPALLPIVDAATEDPALLPVAISALGTLGNDKARHFLGRVILEEAGDLRNSAAVALARIGNRAHEVLRSALRSEEKELRLAAIRALLPFADTDDLSALHTYAYDHADDDPDTVRAVRESALVLEETLAAEQAADAASPPEE